MGQLLTAPIRRIDLNWNLEGQEQSQNYCYCKFLVQFVCTALFKFIFQPQFVFWFPFLNDLVRHFVWAFLASVRILIHLGSIWVRSSSGSRLGRFGQILIPAVTVNLFGLVLFGCEPPCFALLLMVTKLLHIGDQFYLNWPSERIGMGSIIHQPIVIMMLQLLLFSS